MLEHLEEEVRGLLESYEAQVKLDEQILREEEGDFGTYTGDEPDYPDAYGALTEARERLRCHEIVVENLKEILRLPRVDNPGWEPDDLNEGQVYGYFHDMAADGYTYEGRMKYVGELDHKHADGLRRFCFNRMGRIQILTYDEVEAGIIDETNGGRMLREWQRQREKLGQPHN